jgi:hypothetical protein
LATATGSFDLVTNVVSESGQIGNSGPQVGSAYTLQINTNNFHYTGCTGSPNPLCMQWQQFVFDNASTSAGAYIQYWLLRYNAPCPAGAGWTQFQFTGSPDTSCYKDDPAGSVPIPAQPIRDLAQLRLTGAVTTAGDSVILAEPVRAYAVGGPDVGAVLGWNEVEFNVLGDGANSAGGGQANFNVGAGIQARIQTSYGGTLAPVCVAHGFTDETNNLAFTSPAPAPAGPGPALMFNELAGGFANPFCTAASEIG